MFKVNPNLLALQGGIIFLHKDYSILMVVF